MSLLRNTRMQDLKRQCGIYIGIDGCKAGWLAWIFDNGVLKYQISPNLQTLYEDLGKESYCLIDMPIGFSDKANPDRPCDKAARKYLSKIRSSSVFTVPSRQAVFSEDYQSACDVNKALLGKKFSKQTWAIVPKIRELDRFIEQNPSICIRESHPEVVFAAFAGVPMGHNKKTSQGKLERLRLLNSIYPNWMAQLDCAINSTPRKIAMPDDFIDAFALMIACMNQSNLKTLPDLADFDLMGNKREIVYWDLGKRRYDSNSYNRPSKNIGT
jgi:predicted RNase H-like nuclease